PECRTCGMRTCNGKPGPKGTPIFFTLTKKPFINWMSGNANTTTIVYFAEIIRASITLIRPL
ncbi:MAG: hypothetical protein ABJA37_10670, partial [Ferruginibacter sp.]